MAVVGELGYQPFQRWEHGISFRCGSTYLVFEHSPDQSPGPYQRKRAGLNHLAFHAADRDQVDAIVAAAPGHGWSLLFADRHPHAGGPDQYAAYLENDDGYEAEIVAP